MIILVTFVKDDYEIEEFGSHELKGFIISVHIYKLKTDISA
jgi:hypothetical protein